MSHAHIDINTYLFSTLLIIILVTITVALYGILTRPTIIKKIITLTIFNDAINVFIVISGYRRWPIPEKPVVPPVIRDWDLPVSILRTSVDPLPQALVVTAIIINLAITLYLVFLTLQIYRVFKTTDVRTISKLRRVLYP